MCNSRCVEFTSTIYTENIMLKSEEILRMPGFSLEGGTWVSQDTQESVAASWDGMLVKSHHPCLVFFPCTTINNSFKNELFPPTK